MYIQKGGHIMTYTELKEIISTWDENQKRATHILLSEGEYLEDIIETIDNNEFNFYSNFEDYIYESIECTGDKIPDWLCIDLVRTYRTAIRYESNIIFVDSKPKWAEGGDEYGTAEEKEKYWEGIEYLCKYSEVLEVYR